MSSQAETQTHTILPNKKNMTFDQIFEVIKMGLNLGLVFLDIVASVKQIYQELVAKFLSNYPSAEAVAAA